MGCAAYQLSSSITPQPHSDDDSPDRTSPFNTSPPSHSRSRRRFELTHLHRLKYASNGLSCGGCGCHTCGCCSTCTTRCREPWRDQHGWRRVGRRGRVSDGLRVVSPHHANCSDKELFMPVTLYRQRVWCLFFPSMIHMHELTSFFDAKNHDSDATWNIIPLPLLILQASAPYCRLRL